MRSPYAPSMRRTGGQYLDRRSTPGRERRRVPVVRVVPLAGQRVGRVRRVPQDVVGHRHLAAGDLLDLAPDRDHRVAEPVELAEVLALGRLHHERAGDGEGHRRRVEAVVDQPLGDVVDGDAGRPWSARAGRGCTRARPARRGRSRAPGSARAAGRRRSWPTAPRSAWPWSARPRPSAGRRPTRSAGCSPSRTAHRRPGRRPSPGRPRVTAGGWAGTARGGCAHRPGRRPGRRHRAGCRRSCAGSGATRRRRTAPAGPDRPAR